MGNWFVAELDILNTELIEMGTMVETAIGNACKALVTRDAELAKATMAGDTLVNEKERKIEAHCLRLLLHQQPVARDLRFISGATKMITDMERIGDQAQDISEIVTFIAKDPVLKEPEHIISMSEMSVNMVHNSVDAFVRRDVTLAHQVIDADDTVDALFLQVKKDLANELAKDTQSAQDVLDLLMIAKYFERIADHAVNIAEWVEFVKTGLHKGEMLR